MQNMDRGGSVPKIRHGLNIKVPAAVPVRPDTYNFCLAPKGQMYERMLQAQSNRHQKAEKQPLYWLISDHSAEVTTEKMKENEIGLILQMAQRFIDEISELEPGFDRAFYRFYVEDLMYESSSSYTKSDKAFVVDTLERNDFFDEMDEISLGLFEEMERVPAVLLLTIDKEFDYEIQFEYKNMKRWDLSLLDGGRGVPSD